LLQTIAQAMMMPNAGSKAKGQPSSSKRRDNDEAAQDTLLALVAAEGELFQQWRAQDGTGF